MHAVPGAAARPARDRLDEVGLRPRGSPSKRWTPSSDTTSREPAVELGERDELGLLDRDPGRHRTPVELLAASPASRRPRASARSRPSPSLHGFAADREARSSRASAHVEPARRQNERRPPSGDVRCQTLGHVRADVARSLEPGSRSARAVSKRLPIVRGLPVSRSTTGAPSDSSHVEAVIEPLDDQALQRGVAARALRAEVLERRGGARSRRSRGASSRPGGRLSRGRAAPPRARAPARRATRPAMPAPAIARSAI